MRDSKMRTTGHLPSHFSASFSFDVAVYEKHKLGGSDEAQRATKQSETDAEVQRSAEVVHRLQEARPENATECYSLSWGCSGLRATE